MFDPIAVLNTDAKENRIFKNSLQCSVTQTSKTIDSKVPKFCFRI